MVRLAFRRIRTRQEGVSMCSHAGTTDLGEREPADLDEAEEPLGVNKPQLLCGLSMCQSAAMSDATGSDTSETLHELRTDSYLRSGVGATMARYVAISVETGGMVRQRWHRGKD